MKIELCSCLGILWGPSWHPDGSRSKPRPKFDERFWILGWPVGSEMGPTSIKNQGKNQIDFHNDLETSFSRFWDDFCSKKGHSVTFSTSWQIYEKSDFEQHSNGFSIFFDFGSVDFRLWMVYFSGVFSNAILRATFLEFGSNFGLNWTPNRSPNCWKNLWKTKLINCWNFDGF